MTYELLKQLKDAGFPQNNHYYCREDGIISDVCIPTLSKLIEACGDKFGFLSKVQGENSFIAQVPGGVAQFNDKSSTPEEAVIRLYLALNKK